MRIFSVEFSRLTWYLSLLLFVPSMLQAEESQTSIAVIPILDNSPPGLNAARVAAGEIERTLNQLRQFTVVDPSVVAATVRRLNSDEGANGPNWQDVATDLSLDYAALLSVGSAYVEYLGEQFDHLSVGELDSKPGTIYVYEGSVTIHLKIVDIENGKTLLDEEVTGKKSAGYRQSHDAAKYAKIVSAVRELAAIFDKSIPTGGPEQRADEHASLVTEALEKASRKLERPIKRALK